MAKCQRNGTFGRTGCDGNADMRKSLDLRTIGRSEDRSDEFFKVPADEGLRSDDREIVEPLRPCLPSTVLRRGSMTRTL